VGKVEHTFTHFDLTLEVWRAEDQEGLANLAWNARENIDGLPTVFLKAARLGLGSS
jgi:adenine-specific DNA glycosylase